MTDRKIMEQALADLKIAEVDGNCNYGATELLGTRLAQPEQEPVLQDIEQYRMQMAGISTAAIGYWKEGYDIHPDYDTVALRDVARLYAKYDALYKAQRKPLNREQEIALREGYFADAEKEYFEARADCLNTAQNCRLFEAGFNCGWQAAHGIKGGHDD